MSNPKRGIVLLNLGGPSKLSEVRPFLFNLFSDPDILVGIPTPFRQALAAFISTLKGGGSKKAYAMIGGGSPIMKWTTAQARGLESNLNSKGLNTRVTIGMRAWKPYIHHALNELREWGAEEVTLFPLFPQFSTTTTGSCFKEADRILKKLSRRTGWTPKVHRIRNWNEHGGYLALTATTVREVIEKAQANLKADPHLKTAILFSAHSLPMKIIERGDPYPQEIQQTVQGILRELGPLPFPTALAFQSRNGPVPWLQPYTEDELVRLGTEGYQQIVLVPVSFVSDHIETTYELDLLYADLARSHGVKTLVRARMFNDDPAFQDVLTEIYLNARNS